MSRLVPNKCVHVRGNVEGRAYRLISFFHTHPTEVDEEAWTVFRHDDSVFLVDKLTLSVMAEHKCEFLTRIKDESSEEPCIVSVQLTNKDVKDKIVC